MSLAKTFAGRLGLVQRVLPTYRAPFLETLAAGCQGGLDLFAGQPLPGEGIIPAIVWRLPRHTSARNRNFLTPAWPLYLCWQEGLMAWLEETNPDALIVEANPRFLSTPQALRWMQSRKRPVLGWGLGPPAGPWGFVRRLDGVLAYSSAGAQAYKAGGMTAEKVFTALNAVTPPPAFALPERGEAFSSCRLGLARPEISAAAEDSPPRPVVLFVGRIQARKRLSALIRACASLPPELRPRLLIVGEGPGREELRQQAPKWVHFTGALRGEALQACFLAADLFALPGTGGLAIQEAMSYGLPIIAAQGDGTQEDLVRPGNGWRIPPADDFALQQALREALSDLPRLRRMGAESYRIVKEEINLEQMAWRFLQALNQTQERVCPFTSHP